MGKLSDEDWRATDRELRAEAIEILRELDSLGGPAERARLSEAEGRATGQIAGLDAPRSYALGVVEQVLSGFQIILAVVLIVLILMHSGKDSGLSGAFGVGTGAGPLGGGSLVERNLNRWTIVFALLFVGNVFALLKLS